MMRSRRHGVSGPCGDEKSMPYGKSTLAMSILCPPARSRVADRGSCLRLGPGGRPRLVIAHMLSRVINPAEPAPDLVPRPVAVVNPSAHAAGLMTQHNK